MAISVRQAKRPACQYQWRSQNAENVTRIKGRLLEQAVIL